MMVFIRANTPQLDQAIANSRNLTPALKKIQDRILVSNAEAFASQGKSIGQPWTPLAKRWVKRRKKLGLGTTPLEYSSKRGGMLRKSLTEKWAAGAIREVNNDGVIVGSRLVTAGHAQFGMPITRPGRRLVRVPVRPVTAITPALREEIDEIVRTFLAGNES